MVDPMVSFGGQKVFEPAIRRLSQRSFAFGTLFTPENFHGDFSTSRAPEPSPTTAHVDKNTLSERYKRRDYESLVPALSPNAGPYDPI